MLKSLERDGFTSQKRLAPDLGTIEVARALGRVVDVEALLPLSKIPTVQSLKPRTQDEVGLNRYSGHYGLDAFPLHTDLAHWIVPPHYVLLRCIAGSKDVFTNILPWAPIVDIVGMPVIRKALFSRRRRRIGSSMLVRALMEYGKTTIMRWDPIFLEPVNKDAQVLASTMLDGRRNAKVKKILLNEPGDSLLIDNWRTLHGRSQISAESKLRHVERVYLDEVHQ